MATTTVNGAGGSGAAEILSVTVNLDSSTIVGNTAGTLGHAEGVTALAAVPDKRIQVLEVVARYTYATAAYLSGGNLTCSIWDGTNNNPVTNNITAANSFAAANSNTNIASAPTIASLQTTATSLINQKLLIRSSSAYTNPGTAAGTATVTIFYCLVDT